MPIELNFAEKDIEDFLCKDKNLLQYLGLNYVARQVEIFGFRIDILAYSKKEQCFYIIELKKDNLDAKAFTQAFKYYRLMNIKYNKKRWKHNFKILLIGQNLNEDLIGVLSNYYCMNKDHPVYLYTLFDYDLENGISFIYFNKNQKQFEKEIGDFLNDKSR